jgi:flagellar biosynthesis/type III secretory pathway chaperone
MANPVNLKISTSDVSYDVVIKAIITIISDLKTLIEEENSFLNRGYPASLISTTDIKSNLAKKYASLGNFLAEKQQSEGSLIPDAHVHALLLQAGQTLCHLSFENKELLSGALQATKRRVDTIMSAIQSSPSLN